MTEGYIEIILPIFEPEMLGISEGAKQVYAYIQRGIVTTGTLVEVLGYSKGKVVIHLNELLKAGYIIRTGSGRSTKYSIR